MFLRRLLKPIEVANSLREVDAAFIRDNTEGKVWYHGDNDTDLFIWRRESGDMHAWQLIAGEEFVEWNSNDGFATGVISRPAAGVGGESLTRPDAQHIKDEQIDEGRRQFATDVFMAMQSDFKTELLATFTR